MTIEELKALIESRGFQVETPYGRIYRLDDVLPRLAPEILALVEEVGLVHYHGETCVCSLCSAVARFHAKLETL